MITYRGLPGPIISDHLNRQESRAHYAPGTEFQIGRIEMVGNTSTYLDSPFHRYADGQDLSDLPLTSLVNLEGIVLRVTDSSARAIAREAFKNLEVKGKAVLVHTGWMPTGEPNATARAILFLTQDAADYLAQSGAVLVGIDSFNIDDTADGRRPAHSILLGAGIPIVEHLRGLAELPETGFKFFAAPVKVKGFGTFPVRAFAIVA